MRKGIVVLLVVAGVCGSARLAKAQTSVSAGVKIGLNLADIPQAATDAQTGASAVGGTVDTKNRIGFMGGGFVAIPLSKYVDFQPEVLYTQKGLRVVEPTTNTTVRTEVDYFDVPLLLSVGSGRDGVYAFAGPSLDFNVRAKMTNDSALCANQPCGEVDVKDQVNTFEFGTVVGAGVREKWLMIEGRWIQGVSDIQKNPPSAVPHYRNRGFGLLFGLRFP